MVTDHAYVFTIAGRCGRHGCAEPEEAHERLEMLANPVAGCSVDHRSITVARLIGDGGEEWTRCPMCSVHVEPILPEDTSMTGRMRRKASGPGRMPFTQRHWSEIVRLKAAFEGGYYLS